jgi:hypothetical protein
MGNMIVDTIVYFLNFYEKAMTYCKIHCEGLAKQLAEDDAFITQLKILQIKHSSYYVKSMPTELRILFIILKCTASLHVMNSVNNHLKAKEAKKALKNLEKEEGINLRAPPLEKFEEKTITQETRAEEKLPLAPPNDPRSFIY